MDQNKSNEETGVGPCCVCGDETKTRCSACEAVGLDLFFCSREHQKLVWKGAHSRVCGKFANPFHYPPFTPEEAQQAVDLMHTEAPTAESLTAQNLPNQRRRTIVTLLEKEAKLPPPSPEALFHLLQHPEDLPAEGKTGAALSMICLYVYLITTGPNCPSPPPFFTDVPLFQHVAGFFAAVVDCIPLDQHPQCLTSDTITRILHDAVFAFTLVKHSLSPRSPLPRSTIDRFAASSCERLLNFCATLIPFNMAEGLPERVEMLTQPLLCTFPAEVAFEFDPLGGKLLNIKVVMMPAQVAERDAENSLDKDWSTG